MLKKLTISQFVIIDRLQLTLKPGLTILTGETGAGKSILLDALGLILGDPADPKAIRQGALQASIEAQFECPKTNAVWPVLQELGAVSAEQPNAITIYRSITTDDSDEITVNGTTVDLENLKKIGAHLAEIHGQFANQSLLDPANQMHLLDLSGAYPPEVFTNVRVALEDVRRTTKELEEENLFLSNHKRELPQIEAMVRRFDDVGMQEGYIETVIGEYRRLLTAKETSEAFQEMNSQLIATNGAVRALSGAKAILDNNKNMDRVKTAQLSELLTTALDSTRGAVTEMQRLAPEYDIDTRPLNHYREVLNVLRQIAKDTKLSVEELGPYYTEISTKMNRIVNGREKVAALEEHVNEAMATYRHHARILTEHRMAAGKALSAAITAELAPLKLLRAEFEVKVEEKSTMPWTERGINEVTFTARMNPGQPFSPVSETASGGELARLILALKVVLQKVVIIPTLVFDEVDTGIGGAAAAAVGERIAQLADTTQVFVITHSPQVASRHDQHLHVSKSSDGVSTTSVVNTLSLDESVDEISRMLAGETITAESRAAARSLIDEARAAAKQRRAS